MFPGIHEQTFAEEGKPICHSQRYSIWPDRVVEGDYRARAVSRSEIVSNYPVAANGAALDRTWKLQQNINAYPQLSSDYPLLDAVYNLSLEELKLNTRSDGAFNTGAAWEGVWTRDVSYSTLLSLAAVDPGTAKESLLRKVRRGRIVQDTGTGGSWPVSTDRVVWTLAAWEIYLVTGDHGWLQNSYAIIRDSALDDEHVVIDPSSGLAHGESSFLDWREQTYPRWMEPADIYASKSLGTNAVYYRTYRILAAMAKELGESAQPWSEKADRMQSAINRSFWLKERGYYGQYLYGRISQSLSPRADAIGEAFSILFDIAAPAQQDEILRSQPLMDYGIPTVFPETPNIHAYHNRSVWPFVQSFWNLAAAKRDNQAALLYGLASVYRASALFLTNKENFVADTGSPQGTAINSDRQLWSVAGNLAMVYRIFFGMDFAPDGLHLHPVIPESLSGTRTLSNFQYRNAVLNITVKGFGSKIKKITVDGKPSTAVVPVNLTGEHKVIIEMSNDRAPAAKLNLVSRTIAPETPVLHKEDNTLTWDTAEGAASYKVYQNAKLVTTISTAATHFDIPAKSSFAEYQVSSVNAAGVESFLSAPLGAGAAPVVFPATPSDSANAFVMLSSTGTTSLSLAISVPRSGSYALSFRYANGSGPITTDNKCAVRTLFLDGAAAGVMVFPQRGQDQWDNWGISNIQVMKLSAGTHHVDLRLLPHDKNMNGDVNQAAIASLTLIPLD